MVKNIYIIGAGLAGIAAAVRLLASKHAKRFNVVIIEASNRAGGRCFSYYDKKLNAVINSGSHLVLSSNKNLLHYIKNIKAESMLAYSTPPYFPFNDLQDSSYWTLAPTYGIIPLWLLFKERRIPDTTFMMYFSDFFKILFTFGKKTVAEVLGNSPLYKKLWEVLCLAYLNTKPEEADMSLFKTLILKTFFNGAGGMSPVLFKYNLKDTLIDPAITFILGHNGKIFFNNTVSELLFDKKYIKGIKISDNQQINVKPCDKVILCVPPRQAKKLLNADDMPEKYNQITNIHFKVGKDFQLPDKVHFIGAINSLLHWVFKNGEILSITISHSDALTKEKPEAELVQDVWKEICAITQLPPETVIPEYRVINEKCATMSHSLENEPLRKNTKTNIKNFYIAGDWIDTDLPCTMEGAVKSGNAAADIIINKEFSIF